jgi:F-type H+-transporting ATPase subunit a
MNLKIAAIVLGGGSVKLNLTKSDKIFLGVVFGGYVAVIIYIVATGYKFSLRLGHDGSTTDRWRRRSAGSITTIIMRGVMGIVIVMATRVKVFKLVPAKSKSSGGGARLYLQSREDSVSRKEFVRPLFDIAASCFCS